MSMPNYSPRWSQLFWNIILYSFQKLLSIDRLWRDLFNPRNLSWFPFWGGLKILTKSASFQVVWYWFMELSCTEVFLTSLKSQGMHIHFILLNKKIQNTANKTGKEQWVFWMWQLHCCPLEKLKHIWCTQSTSLQSYYFKVLSCLSGQNVNNYHFKIIDLGKSKKVQNSESLR